jgi:DNA-binding IclR family transcriptional regulator
VVTPRSVGATGLGQVSRPGTAASRAGKESSLTLERGLAVLQAVADSESEAPTISDLAVAIGASRAAVYRLLVPLVERGLVRREGSRVRLGLGMLRLAARVLPQLRMVAIPVLRSLAEEVGATAHLTVADSDAAQAVAVVDGLPRRLPGRRPSPAPARCRRPCDHAAAARPVLGRLVR